MNNLVAKYAKIYNKSHTFRSKKDDQRQGRVKHKNKELDQQ